ncbi:MAG TPA: M67 family metallopeptidase [Erythrobacter sp.]|nr:M67 family metallopeptidase [Erythrobacter sp.]
MKQSIIQALRNAAASALPRECCGILLGTGNRFTEARPAANVHPRPETHFEIDPQALIDAHRAARAGGPQVLGYYHSHPTGAAEPSATDRAMASGDGRVWAIVGTDKVSFWQDTPDGFRALSYLVEES